MARKNKNDNVAGVILVILGIIGWGVYVAVKALINVNERFIDSASTPEGIVGLFFGLLVMASLLIRVFIYRGFRQKTAALKQKETDLEQKEQAFEDRVSVAVSRSLERERNRLASHWEEFREAKNKASRALQRIVDSAYKFKVKTLLAGTTVNNWQTKYDQLRKEQEAYAVISEKITFLELEDWTDPTPVDDPAL